MKERINTLINNLIIERKVIIEEVQEINWALKYAPLMSGNCKERKQELLVQFNRVNEEIKKLKWILEGDNNE